MQMSAALRRVHIIQFETHASCESFVHRIVVQSHHGKQARLTAAKAATLVIRMYRTA